MNRLEGLLHSQWHTTDGDLVVFQCAECDYASLSVGQLHGHAEQHRDLAVDPFGLIVPPWRWAEMEELWALTEIVTVDGGRTVTRQDVVGL